MQARAAFGRRRAASRHASSSGAAQRHAMLRASHQPRSAHARCHALRRSALLAAMHAQRLQSAWRQPQMPEISIRFHHAAFTTGRLRRPPEYLRHHVFADRTGREMRRPKRQNFKRARHVAATVPLPSPPDILHVHQTLLSPLFPVHNFHFRLSYRLHDNTVSIEITFSRPFIFIIPCPCRFRYAFSIRHAAAAIFVIFGHAAIRPLSRSPFHRLCAQSRSTRNDVTAQRRRRLVREMKTGTRAVRSFACRCRREMNRGRRA